MREIKFRGLNDDHSNCNFVYGDLVYDLGIPRIKELSLEMLFTTCIEGTEGQYTGLKDKNGKEIYEGDLVVVNDGFVGKFRQILFSDDLHGWCYKIIGYVESATGENIEGRVKLIQYNRVDDIEIIGNIHENPELL